MKKLNATKLRRSEPTEEDLKKIKRNPIYFVLDEVLDTFNIGSMFRLADATAIEKMYLCGRMETPPSHRIHKAAVGTEKWIPWEHVKNSTEAVKMLKKSGVYTIAIEQDKRSIPYTKMQPKFPVAIVLGHETTGVRKETLDLVDQIVELPMHGINISFNVWGSASVVAYKLVELLNLTE
ncbi:TrmH family RNA methyltransferase [Candidatus Woesebacteria bacterium]|nr:TrmH family RNA methyltransferase [Candidatus Woesebacteria bacterium]